MSDLLLSAQGLEVGYGVRQSIKILRGVNLTLRRGETLGIVGESGSGKTTLGRALVRLIDTSAGKIGFDGRDITRLSDAEMLPLRSRIQMIFQDPMSSLNPRHTIRHILTGPLLLHRQAENRKAAERQASQMLSRVGLPNTAMDRYPHELSGGQRQRVGIARAIVLKPDFVLADEIVSGLDVSTQAQVLQLIRDLTREMGLAMAFISHDLSVIRAVCDRVMVLQGGLVVEEGDCDTVFRSPQAAYTQTLIDAIPLPEIMQGWLDTRPTVAAAPGAVA